MLPLYEHRRGCLRSCAEFRHEYEQHAQRFVRYQRRFGAQFVVTRAVFSLDAKGPAELTPIADAEGARCVNDEERLERRFEMTCDPAFWRDAGVMEGLERVPLHCAILSRCIATIHYETPCKEDAMRLWRLPTGQFRGIG